VARYWKLRGPKRQGRERSERKRRIHEGHKEAFKRTKEKKSLSKGKAEQGSEKKKKKGI